MDTVKAHVCYRCHYPAQPTPTNQSRTDVCEKCGHRGEGQIRSTVRCALGQLVVVEDDEKARRMAEAFRPLAEPLNQKSATFLHGDGGWRFATSPSSGHQPFKLLAGECLIAEVSPCPTFGSGWSDEEILTLIASAPNLLSALKAVVAVADRDTDAFDQARLAIARATGGGE